MLSFSGRLPLQPLDLLLPTISVAIVVYGLVLGIYRLYLSPLAGFPGPKLAALTQWYEAYYDLFHNGGGHFTFHLKKMHEKYGIRRILLVLAK